MTVNIPRFVTATSAAALVVASAGLGAFYAWNTGSHHGPIIGALSVLMALGLEGAKPFAIEGVFVAFRSRLPARAVALAVLGSVAVTYSLSAELSLFAATRADSAAQRTQASDAVAAAKARYFTARRELEALAMTRPVATANAEIARLKTTRGLAPCGDPAAPSYGGVTRRVCAQIAALSAEAATSARRDELRTTLRSAERDFATAPLATDADPAASTLVMFLAAAGVPTDPGAVSKWLALVPVLALEVGSALAVLLVGETVPGPQRSQTVPSNGNPIGADFDVESANLTSTRPSTTPVTLKMALLQHLETQGGRLNTGQRGLARTLGTSTTELHRTLHTLSAAGAIELKTAPTGTEIRIQGRAKPSSPLQSSCTTAAE